MVRRVALLSLMVAGLTLVAQAGWASNTQYHQGEPTAVFQTNQVTASGDLSGVGNQAVTANLDAKSDPVTATCTSPGGNSAPGRNPVTVSGTGSATVTSDKNGNAHFSVTATPVPPTAKEAGCPNNHWTVSTGDVNFKTATLTLSQHGSDLSDLTRCFTNPGNSSPVTGTAGACS